MLKMLLEAAERKHASLAAGMKRKQCVAGIEVDVLPTKRAMKVMEAQDAATKQMRKFEKYLPSGYWPMLRVIPLFSMLPRCSMVIMTSAKSKHCKCGRSSGGAPGLMTTFTNNASISMAVITSDAKPRM